MSKLDDAVNDIITVAAEACTDREGIPISTVVFLLNAALYKVMRTIVDCKIIDSVGQSKTPKNKTKKKPRKKTL